MPTYAIKGSKFEIGAAVVLKATDYVAADFTAPLAAAVEVKEPETFGTFSDEWQMEEFANATTGRVTSHKVNRKGKGVEFVFGLDPTDAGQLAMRVAGESEGNFVFRFTFADKPATGTAPKNSTRLFVGTVQVEDDASGKIGKLKVTITPNANIVSTNASPT